MASTLRSRSTSVRSTQRKLNKICKAVRELPEIQIVFDTLDNCESYSGQSDNEGDETGPHKLLDCLVDDKKISSYGDDVTAFTKDVEQFFSQFIELVGKTPEIITIHQAVNRLLAEQFEDLEQQEDTQIPAKSSTKISSSDKEDTTSKSTSTKKKSYEVANLKDTQPTKSSTTTTRLDNTAKSFFKTVLTVLTNHTYSKPFLHPVDKNLYPEYYQNVPTPMDLSTVKSKLTSNAYTTVIDVIHDIRLIFANCQQYNKKGSEIVTWAKEMSTTFESLLLNGPFAQLHYTNLPPTTSTTAAGSRDMNSTVVVQKTEKESKSSTTKKGVSSASSGATTAVSSSTGRDPNAPPVLPAVTIIPNKKTVSTINNLLKSLTLHPTRIIRKIFLKIIEGIRNHPLSVPFHFPVDLRLAPGYLDVIEKAMDLQTLENNVTKKMVYDSDIFLFYFDLQRIWSNCCAYNIPNSEIVIRAQTLAKFADQFIIKVISDFHSDNTTLDEKEAKETVTPPPSIPPSSNLSAVPIHNANSSHQSTSTTTTTIAQPPVAATTITPALAPAPAKKRGRRSLAEIIADNAKLAKEKETQSKESLKHCREILQEIMTHNLSGPFRLPVDPQLAPGYLDIVKEPLDLTTIKKRLDKLPVSHYEDDIHKFFNDLLLIFNNCLSYNLEGSDIYNTAILLNNRVIELFKLKFDSIEWEEENKPHQKRSKTTNIAASTSSASTAITTSELTEVEKYAEQTSGKTTSRRKSQIKVEVIEKESSVEVDEEPVIVPLIEDGREKLIIKIADRRRSSDLAVAKLREALSHDNITTFNAKLTKALKQHNEGTLPAPILRQITTSHSTEELHRHLQCLKQDLTFTSDLVRQTSHQLSKSFLDKLKLPFYLNNVEYKHLGTIDANASGSVTSSSIYPNNYETVKIIQLRIFPPSINEPSVTNPDNCDDAITATAAAAAAAATPSSNASSLHVVSTAPRLTIELHSRIVLSDGGGGGKPSYQITMFDDHVIVSQSYESPQQAWANCFTSPPPPPTVTTSTSTSTSTPASNHSTGWHLLRTIGSSIRRCRAVLNRLAISSDSGPFLKPVPHSGPTGIDYYRVIKSPMWLEEIHFNIMNAKYENPYDFAWDMRLIFENCKKFNMEGSELFQRANRLSDFFEQLFCQWVLNVHDESITNWAKGPWDDWQHLKYFDTMTSATIASNQKICALTGIVQNENEVMITCETCSDSFSQTALRKHTSHALTTSQSSSSVHHHHKGWNCHRCSSTAYHNIKVPFPEASRKWVENGGYWYSVANDIGVGWMRISKPVPPVASTTTTTTSTATGGDAKKPVILVTLLSPLGQEISSTQPQALQKLLKEEKQMHEWLLVDRQKEYAESLRADRGIHKRGSKKSIRELLPENPLQDMTKSIEIHSGIMAVYDVPNNWEIQWYDMAEILNEENHQSQALEGIDKDKKNDQQAGEEAVQVKVEEKTMLSDSTTENEFINDTVSLSSVSTSIVSTTTTDAVSSTTTPPVVATTTTITSSTTSSLQPLTATSLLITSTTTTGTTTSSYFGLDPLAIRICIEGLPHADQCKSYQFTSAPSIHQQLIILVQSEYSKKLALDKSMIRLKDYVAEERWYWQRRDEELLCRVSGGKQRPLEKRHPDTHLLLPSQESSIISEDLNTPTPPPPLSPPTSASLPPQCSDYIPFVPPGISPMETEKLLSLWEFITSAARPIFGDTALSFEEIAKSILPPNSDYPTISQIIFDEIACLLTDFLVLDLKYITKPKSDPQWQDLLALKPVNILTWSYVASEMLAIHCTLRNNHHFTTAHSLLMINNAVCGVTALENDILYLLMNHPLIEPFMSPPDPIKYPTYSQVIPQHMDVNILRNRCFPIATTTTTTPPLPLSTFLLDIQSIWDNALTFYPLTSQVYSYARCLRQWFRGLLVRWGMEIVALQEVIPEVCLHADMPLQYYDATVYHPSTCYREFHQMANTSTSTTSTTTTVISKSHQQNPATLGHFVPPSESELCSLSELNDLELSLRLLRRRESEQWTQTQRLTVLMALMEECISSQTFRNTIQKCYTEPVAAGADLDSIAGVPETPADGRDAVLHYASDKQLAKTKKSCLFTGIEPKHVSGSRKFVYVPVEHCHLPTSLPSNSISSSSSNSSSSSSSSSNSSSSSSNSSSSSSSNSSSSSSNSSSSSTIIVPINTDTTTTSGESSSNHNEGGGGTGTGTVPVEPMVVVNESSEIKTRKRSREQMDELTEKEEKKYIHLPIGLDFVIRKLMAAREVAEREREQLEQQQQSLVDRCSQSFPQPIPEPQPPAFAPRTVPKTTMRMSPLGYDHLRNEYWLLGCQSYMSLASLSTANGPSVYRSDPTILVRNPRNNTWLRHTGVGLETILNSLSDNFPAEKSLKRILTEKLLAARNKLEREAISVMKHQKTFLHRQRKAEKWLAGLSPNLISKLSPKDYVKFMELVWARCVEVRLSVHYSVIRNNIVDFPEDGDPSRYDREQYARRKRIRDVHLEEFIDFHPYMGWQRFDGFSQIRGLSACTSATRILGDASIYSFFQLSMRRSRIRRETMKVSSEGSRRMSTTTNDDNEYFSEDSEDSPRALARRNMEKQNREDSDNIDSDMEGGGGGGGGGGDHNDMIDDENQKYESGYDAHNNSMGRVKAVEQIHMETGEVVRRYASGKVAALAMKAAQSGISLCCKGSKSDAYGFKWRFYEGDPSIPPINPWDIEDLLLIRFAKKKDREDLPISRQPIASTATPSLPTSSSGGDNSTFMRYQVGQVGSGQGAGGGDGGGGSWKRSHGRPTTYRKSFGRESRGGKKPVDMIVSTVTVNARMARLKVELLNILTVLPDRKLQWPISAAAPDTTTPSHANLTPAVTTDSSAMMTEDAHQDQEADKEGEVARTMTTTTTTTTTLLSADQERLAHKARKRLRRQRRIQAHEQFITAVVEAESIHALLQCVMTLEEAIPFPCMYQYPKHTLPTAGDTVAVVAMRIFCLDRALRYEDIDVDYRQTDTSKCPRVKYSPRCLLLASCTKPLCHGGRCNAAADSFSRFVEVVDAPGQYFGAQYRFPAEISSSNYGRGGGGGAGGGYVDMNTTTNTTTSSNNGVRGNSSMPPYTSRNQDTSGTTIGDKKTYYGIIPILTENGELNADAVQPYIPRPEEIAETEWV